MHASFDAASLLPVVGPFLAGSVGPIDYTLLSVAPGVGQGLYQNFSFTPDLKVNLTFSSPVREADGTVTNHVLLPVDGTPVTLTPATVGSFLDHSLKIQPTFILDNQFHNQTGLTLEGDVDVTALQLSGLFDAGPAFHQDPDLFQIPIPLFDDTFKLDIPPITTAAQAIARLSDFNTLFSVDVNGVLDQSGQGSFDLKLGGQTFAEGVAGRLVRFPTGGFGCGLTDIDTCQTVLVTNEDVFNGDDDLGSVFCIKCFDLSPFLSQTSPVLTAGDGSSLFLSDLSTFPHAPTPDDIRSSDPIFGGSNFFESFQTTPAGFTPDVPEPATVFLFGSALFGLAAFRRRRLKG